MHAMVPPSRSGSDGASPRAADATGTDSLPRTAAELTDEERHKVLWDASEGDRWRWRARIRANPVALFWYRLAVALGGLALMVGALFTGPLPGPGGIPLFLLGLALWASEFRWAHRLMHWFKTQFERYRVSSRKHKALFWVAFTLVIWTLWYLGMVVIGLPGWIPEWSARWLDLVPGIQRRS